MKLSVIKQNRLCAVISGKELEKQSLDYKTASVMSESTRRYLLEIYSGNASRLGLPSAPEHLEIALYPFINGGMTVVYSAGSNEPFFCRFECADDLLDCLSKLAELKSEIGSFTLFKTNGSYCAQVSSSEKAQRFLLEYSSEKCCQKKEFYLNYAEKISQNLFT